MQLILPVLRKFYQQNKQPDNKLTPILLILIHLSISATACKQVLVNWMEQPAVTCHWFIMVLLLGISKNKNVLAKFCITVLQQSAYLRIHYSAIAPFASPSLPPPILSSPISWASSKVKDK